MRKIAGLYQNYLRECEEKFQEYCNTPNFSAYSEKKAKEFQEYCTGGDKVNQLKDFLKKKLNADDYLTAEELLNEALSETEEKGFTGGCRYISGLAKELFAE